MKFKILFLIFLLLFLVSCKDEKVEYNPSKYFEFKPIGYSTECDYLAKYAPEDFEFAKNYKTKAEEIYRYVEQYKFPYSQSPQVNGINKDYKLLQNETNTSKIARKSKHLIEDGYQMKKYIDYYRASMNDKKVIYEDTKKEYDLVYEDFFIIKSEVIEEIEQENVSFDSWIDTACIENSVSLYIEHNRFTIPDVIGRYVEENETELQDKARMFDSFGYYIKRFEHKTEQLNRSLDLIEVEYGDEKDLEKRKEYLKFWRSKALSELGVLEGVYSEEDPLPMWGDYVRDAGLGRFRRAERFMEYGHTSSALLNYYSSYLLVLSSRGLEDYPDPWFEVNEEQIPTLEDVLFQREEIQRKIDFIRESDFEHKGFILEVIDELGWDWLKYGGEQSLARYKMVGRNWKFSGTFAWMHYKMMNDILDEIIERKGIDLNP